MLVCLQRNQRVWRKNSKGVTCKRKVAPDQGQDAMGKDKLAVEQTGQEWEMEELRNMKQVEGCGELKLGSKSRVERSNDVFMVAGKGSGGKPSMKMEVLRCPSYLGTNGEYGS